MRKRRPKLNKHLSRNRQKSSSYTQVLQFQDLTGIEDITICRDVLQRHQWNLEVAVQEQLNMREGRPSVYASESRPPAVVSDHMGQHIYYTPPIDGSASGLRGLIRAVVGILWNVCYGTVLTLLQITRRMLGYEIQPRPDPLEEVMQFIHQYEERFGTNHPVFYRGTLSQALNDSKRELRFLLVYLHDPTQGDSELFCRQTWTDQRVQQYVNNNFLMWVCDRSSEEGRKAGGTLKAGTSTGCGPWVGVLVFREGRMSVVGRSEGFCDAPTLLQRLQAIVSDFELSLVQARNDRLEQSFNRSLRQHQDEAFLESLRADQEKERRREEQRRQEELERQKLEEEKRAEEERRMSIAQEKVDSVHKVPAEPDASHPDAVHVVFKLPCGQRLDRRFLRSHSLEHVFYFVFCHPNAPDSFEITTNFPKRVLPCRPRTGNERIQTLEEAGLKNREVLFINDLDA